MGDLRKFIIILSLIFAKQGIEGVIEFCKSLLYSIWELLKMINMISIELLGESLLTTLFSHRIVFYIVGTLLSMFCVGRSKTGKYIGKILYKAIMYPISSILNFLGGINLFKI